MSIIIGFNYPTLTVSAGLLLLLVGQFVPPRKKGNRPLNESAVCIIASGIVSLFSSAWSCLIVSILMLLMGIFYLYEYFTPDEDWPSGGGDDLHTDGMI